LIINHNEHNGHNENQTKDCPEELIALVLDCAFEVHRELGPGLLESVYERALAFELADKGIAFERQVDIGAYYKGRDLGLGFRADIVVDGRLLIELKAVDDLGPAHLAQIMTYLRLLKLKRGLLLNFNKRLLKEGIKRVVL
jgi:GxxExxY protein